jgi:hypothetical protein
MTIAMNHPGVAERARKIAAENFPGVPFQMICSLAYSRTLGEGRHEYQCSQCGDTQIVSELDDATETKVCSGARQ